MGTASSLFGKKGEEIAGRFLTSRGYRILDRNFRTPRGEIDLIVLDGEYLVFVEVKSRRGNRFGAPQDAVDRRKQEHLIKASQFYMTRKKLENICCRFDRSRRGRGVGFGPNTCQAYSEHGGGCRVDAVTAPVSHAVLAAKALTFWRE